MEQNIISVTELTSVIKNVLEDGFTYIKVKGELSNYKQHTSGHKYFTLKDEGASISCVMWRGKTVDFTPKDGQKVIISGSLTVYPQRGNYQINCDTMEQVGQGDLWLAFEALKRKLDAKGYFDSNRKRSIPVMPMKVGIATSPTGAAVRDMFSTIERRFPALRIFFRPSVVQGDATGPDIAKAIEEFNKLPLDVIIIGRGGGSLEDLWGFNTEVVADAIFNSKIPVISAVGHETDFSISDFVADLRAATPTAAAELVTPHTLEILMQNLHKTERNMKKTVSDNVQNYKETLSKLMGIKAKKRIIEKINFDFQFLDDARWRIKTALTNKLSSYNQFVNNKTLHIKSLSPLAPLEKGFAILKSNGKIIEKNDSLIKFKTIEIARLNESIEVKIIGNKQEPLF